MLWATGYRIRAMGYGMHATGYGLWDTGYSLQATVYGLHATGYGIHMKQGRSHSWRALMSSWCADWQNTLKATDRDDNQSCHILTVLFNQIKSVIFMYSYIGSSFNYMLMRKTSSKLDLKLSLFAITFAFCFTRLSSKKRHHVFLSWEQNCVHLEKKIYSTSICLGKCGHS